MLNYKRSDVVSTPKYTMPGVTGAGNHHTIIFPAGAAPHFITNTYYGRYQYCWAGLGWAGLGWAGLVWAGLGPVTI